MIKVANIQTWQLIQEIESETLKFFYILLMTILNFKHRFFLKIIALLGTSHNLFHYYVYNDTRKYLDIYHRQLPSVHYIYYIKRFEV